MPHYGMHKSTHRFKLLVVLLHIDRSDSIHDMYELTIIPKAMSVCISHLGDYNQLQNFVYYNKGLL